MKTKSKKKLVIVLIIIAVILCVVIYLLDRVRRDHNMAYVQPVSDLNSGYISNNTTMSGSVTDDNAQEFYVDGSKTVSKVYVNVGDSVKAGTVLFSYDDKSINGELTSQNMVYESDKAALDIQNQLLTYYQNIVPIPDTTDVPDTPDAPSVPDDKSNTGDTGKDSNSGTGDGGTTDNSSGTSNKSGTDSTGGTTTNNSTDSNSTGTTGSGNSSKLQKSALKTVVVSDPALPASGMTQKEKDDAIKETSDKIKTLKSSILEEELNIKKLKQQISDTTVKAAVPGIVKSIGDTANPSANGKAFLTIGSTEGSTVTGYMNENDILNAKIGDQVNINDYMSSANSVATITELNYYPATNYNNGGSTQASSYYKFKAYLETGDGFNLNDDVEITKVIPNTGNVIVLQRIYVRNDNKGNYVMIDNGKGKLKKQSVSVKSTGDAESIQITKGLKGDEKIAFPYGKTATVGNKTTTKQKVSIFNVL